VIAVDTNILVRLIVDDDEDQVEKARKLAEDHSFFVSLTVLVETEWVLRSRYEYDRASILNAMNQLAFLVDLCFDNADDVRWALDRFASGGELADYLHIASARSIGLFATFEKRLGTRAGELAPARVVMLA
jgi:predicted nucleic-acid-binding protein